MRKIFFLLLMGLSCIGIAQQQNDSQLTTQANVIRNETTPGANTKGRIADMYQALTNSKLSVIPLSASGTNIYIAASAVVTSYSSCIFEILFQNGNTTTSTLSINSLGTVNLQKLVSGSYVALSSGDIQSNQLLKVWYDQPNNTFQVFLGGVGSGGGGTWGSITGTLSAQTDLQTALNAKQSTITFGIGVQTALGVNIGSAGANVLFNGAGGTPSSLTLTNATSLPISTGLSGLGTSVATALGVNVGSAGAVVILNGALGTPSSGTATNLTGLPVSTGISGLGSGVAALLATFSSANEAAALIDETGTGAAVFGTTPTIATPVINGLSTGTGVASAATASTLAARDANANLSANNVLPGYTTTVTAAGTTTLTVSSTQEQYFTGSTTQTLVLPVTSTLSTNPQITFTVVNNSTGAVTVQSSGANTITIMAAGSQATFSCISTSGTGASSWSYLYVTPYPLTAVGDLFAGGTVVNGFATPTRIAAAASSNNFLMGNVGAAPSYSQPTSDQVLASSTSSSATAGNIGETISGTAVTTYTSFTTTATYKNIASIALTGGDWIIKATFTLYGNGATITTASDAIFLVATTTASASGSVEGKSIFYIPQQDFALNSSGHASGTIIWRPSPTASSVTYYLNAQATYTVGAMQYVGHIEATRAR